jgi:four helix bundle protein
MSDLPNTEKFGLRSQMTRAAVSVPSNIAEGCSRNNDKEFKRFLEYSMGSLFELETQLILTEELGMLSADKVKLLLEDITRNERQINCLINKIKADM